MNNQANNNGQGQGNRQLHVGQSTDNNAASNLMSSSSASDNLAGGIGNDAIGRLMGQQGPLPYQQLINQQRLLALQGGTSLNAHLLGIGGGGGGLDLATSTAAASFSSLGAALGGLGSGSAITNIAGQPGDMASMFSSFPSGFASAAFPRYHQQGLGTSGMSNSQQLNPWAEAATSNRLLQLQGLQGAMALEQLQFRNSDGGRSLLNWIGNMSGQGDPYAEHGILGPWSATSAGLLGSMAASNSVEKTKKVRKKAKDKPKRPLSAYNVFFKEERNRLLEERRKSVSGGKEQNDSATASEDGKKEVDGKKNSRGKIGFESLAKVIGHRWQELTSEQVNYYKRKADEDMIRYKREMEAYNVANKAKTEDNHQFDKEAADSSTKRSDLEDAETTTAEPPIKKARPTDVET